MPTTPEPLQDLVAEMQLAHEQIEQHPDTITANILGRMAQLHQELLKTTLEHTQADWSVKAMIEEERTATEKLISDAYIQACRDAEKIEELLELTELAESEEDEKPIAEALGKIVWDDSGRPDPLLILKQLAPERHAEFVDVMRRGIELYDRLSKIPHYTVIATQDKWDANAEAVRENADIQGNRLSA